MVAYSPANSTAERASPMSSSTPLLAVRVGRYAIGVRHVLGEDDRRLAILVLLHHERVLRLLPRLGRERQLAPGQEALHLQADQGAPHRLAVDRVGLLNSREHGPSGLVAERLVPLRVAVAVLGPERVHELLVETAGAELGVPPHRAQYVVHV